MTSLPEITTILVGTDGSTSATAAVDAAAALAGQTGAEVVLVHAVGLLEHLADHPTELSNEVRADVEALMRGEWSKTLRDNDIPHRLVTENGPPLLVLPRVADEVDADLIVVASHGTGASVALALGSTTHGIVQLSTRPVLVVPARGDL